MAVVAPIVFVVDDDISMRESLEFLIISAGWRPEVRSHGDADHLHHRPGRHPHDGAGNESRKAHRGQVMRKMRARSLPELVNIAGRLCLETAGKL